MDAEPMVSEADRIYRRGRAIELPIWITDAI
jgi:hypothetical protein